MVGSVPQSAKLKELAVLFSGEAKGLQSASIGAFAFSGFPVRPGSGNPYEALKIHHERTARSGLRSGSEGLTLELHQTFGYLTSVSEFEEWSLRSVRDR